MIVVDIGCARYGGDYSIERLIEEFHPDVLYGFDPNPVLVGGLDGDQRGEYRIGKTKVVLERSAAWIFDGEIGFVDDGLNSWITDRTEEPRVKCFDIAGFMQTVRARHPHDPIVLKIDAEGAEYDLLERLIEAKRDIFLKLAWVEWHSGPERAGERRRTIEAEIACELAEWRW